MNLKINRSENSIYSNLKMSVNQTIHFIELYKSEPCLWNTSIDNYRNQDERAAATKRIAAEMQIEGFGPQEVLIKFKNLRNSYCQELKKISKSIKAGKDEIYKPKVIWFHIMDSFLLPHVHARVTRCYLSPSPTLKVKNEPDFDSDLDGTGSESTAVTAERELLYHTINTPSTSTSFYHSSPMKMTSRNAQKQKYLRNNNFNSASKCKPLMAVSGGTVAPTNTEKKEDCYDHFAKYVASLMRCLPPKQAFPLQSKIINLIVSEHLNTSNTASWLFNIRSASSASDKDDAANTSPYD